MKVNKFVIPITLIFLLLMIPIPAPAQTDIPRNEILWSSGFWGPPGVNNPAHTLSASWESKFMYDVLFDWNSALEDPLVPFLGETIEWSEDGSVLTITLKTVATWSDNYSITADDVVYTFNEIYGDDGGPLNSVMEQKIASIEKTGEYEVTVTVNSGFEFSKVVYYLFIGRWQILPAHIWPDVIAYESVVGNSKYQMAVNWLEPSFPDDLKVSSGMYVPFSQAIDGSWSLYERRDNWWGLGVLSDSLPAPKYIGMRAFPTNLAADTAYITGGIDWFGNYIENIGQKINQNANLSTYFGNNDPYFASLSSIVEIVPNHHIYPLSEVWMRQAIAYALDIQDMIDIGASGYLEAARVARIDDRSPQLANLYNETIEETYGFEYDLDTAIDILEENAVKVDGSWYTKDTPLEWQSEYSDALPGEPGFNVKIGPYEIMTPSGWSDFELHIQTFQLQMDAIDIDIETEKKEYAAYSGAHQTMNFDFALYGEGPGLLDSALAMFDYFEGPEGRGANKTGWYNPIYGDLLNQFEVAIEGSPEEYDLASKMQEEIARDLPSIPLFGNGYWYSFNTEFWANWPTENGNEMPPMAMWGFGNTGLMNQLLWSLEATGAVGDDSVGLGTWIFIIPAVLLVPIIWRTVKRR